MGVRTLHVSANCQSNELAFLVLSLVISSLNFRGELLVFLAALSANLASPRTYGATLADLGSVLFVVRGGGSIRTSVDIMPFFISSCRQVLRIQ